MLDKVYVSKSEFLKGLKNVEVANYFLWIENSFVEPTNLQELEKVISSKDEDYTICYSDDVGFEAYNLSQFLTENSIEHKYVEGGR